MSGTAEVGEVEVVFSKGLVWMGIFAWRIVSELSVAQEGEASSLLTIASQAPAIRISSPHLSARGLRSWKCRQVWSVDQRPYDPR